MICILGSGPHGREIADIAEACDHMAVMLDDNDQVKDIDGPISRYEEMGYPYVLGPAWPHVRRAIFGKIVGSKEATTLIHPDTTVSPSAKIGRGVVLGPGVRVTTGSVIGAHSHMGVNSALSHSCSVGDFCMICPGVNISGEVWIGNDVFVGVGAVIKNGIRIGAGALIGAGAVVVKDVAPGMIVVGNPARPYVKR